MFFFQKNMLLEAGLGKMHDYISYSLGILYGRLETKHKSKKKMQCVKVIHKGNT